jgi:hypothetical protein
MFCLLKVIDGPARGAQLRLLDNQRLAIGRLSTADFSISGDQHLSRNHMVIEGEGGAFRVRDEGSRNGTFVNNILIRSTILCSGDIIRAGKSLFQVQLRHEPQLAEPAPAESEKSPFFSMGIPYRTIETPATALTPQNEKDYAAPVGLNDDATLLSPPVKDLSLLGLVLKEFSLDRTTKWIWRQNEECDHGRWCNLLDSINRLGVHLNFIINQTQVDFSEFTTRDQLPQTPSMLQLSQTLWMIRSSEPSVLSRVFMSCWGRDAAIVVGTRDDFETRWLEDALDVISYPSLLKSVLSTSDSRAHQLSKGIQFLLFESDSDNRLRLLPGKEMHEKFSLLEDGASRNHTAD